jgi:uncharacterized RDD family membrane protein YckC
MIALDWWAAHSFAGFAVLGGQEPAALPCAVTVGVRVVQYGGQQTPMSVYIYVFLMAPIHVRRRSSPRKDLHGIIPAVAHLVAIGAATLLMKARRICGLVCAALDGFSVPSAASADLSASHNARESTPDIFP